MCDERERLIGFVYDECDAGERQQIESHLESCGTCRQEIAGLRSVREDLLAWSVPEHQPVWRPLPVAVVAPWWRQTPGWAFAAAASVVLVAGLAGGAATRAFPVRQAAAPAGVTAAELGAVEQQILQMRSELERVRRAAAEAPVALTADPTMNDALERRVATQLEESDRKTFDRANQLWSDFNTIRAADRAGSDQSLRKMRQELDLLTAAIAALEQKGGGR